MRTSLLRSSGTAAFAIAIVLAAPAGAADFYVPPSNSAATQYTESFPSAKGERNAEREAEPSDRPAERTLGKRTTRQLEAAGPSGTAVAEVVVETAPAVAAEAPPVRRDAGTVPDDDEDRADSESGVVVPESDGGSGLGPILAGAVGVSAAGGGPLLPLAILATVIWALAFARRRRPGASG